MKKSSVVDFAVFAFTPDDVATIRKQEEAIARDNVVFELGLFIGAIGKDRCYIVKPRGVEMHLPSDLLGMNPADYAVDRPDGDVESALNYACKLIKDRIRDLGAIDRLPFSKTSKPFRHTANPPEYKLQDSDLLFLSECVKSEVSSPIGHSFDEIGRELSRYPYHILAISAIKLERLGYIAKLVEHTYNGDHQYFAFSATEDGLDAFLKHEARIAELNKPIVRTAKVSAKKSPQSFDQMDDDIPF
ncbi:nucleotide-binding protein [Ottowia testudinis]|uniref:Nucleotide-binding protein n=1 Tax=Ottowia testudinis TaxID=2816950 RepID=A0A975CC87_9BURK|nr:nucleotide-binding protein [Ottowia testudinis]